MKIGRYEITFRRKHFSSVDTRGGWWPLVVNEPYAGAWQRNDPILLESVLSNSTVYRCITLIAGDISKMRLRLMNRTADGIDEEIEAAAFSPVLDVPNHYQNGQQFIERWLISKLIYGNTYVLKSRDNRNVVNELYVLDPARVKVLQAPNSEVFYELQQDQLSGLEQNRPTVPQNDIIHDRNFPFFHPLSGISPLFCAGLPAGQSLRIQKYSDKFFSNSARPSGILTAPGTITEGTAKRLKETWEANYTGENSGRVAVMGDGLKFEGINQNAVDSQLIEQSKLSDERVCTAFGVPGYKAGISPPPAYNNIEAMNYEYYSGCLQDHIHSIERLMRDGLELPKGYSVKFDLDDLVRMDTATMIDAMAKGVVAALITPNEGRKRLGLGKQTGGDVLYLQQQNFSLPALAERDKNKPFAKPTAPTAAPVANDNIASQAMAALAEIRKGLDNVGI